MYYLIDGHNLIAHYPDIELEDPNDEVKLVLVLRSWAAAGRKREAMDVFMKARDDERYATAIGAALS